MKLCRAHVRRNDTSEVEDDFQQFFGCLQAREIDFKLGLWRERVAKLVEIGNEPGVAASRHEKTGKHSERQ